MDTPQYPGMIGPSKLVGDYYLAEGARIASERPVTLYFRQDGGIGLRDKTGRFASITEGLERHVQHR